MTIYTVLIMKDYNVGKKEIKNFLSEEEAQKYREEMEKKKKRILTTI